MSGGLHFYWNCGFWPQFLKKVKETIGWVPTVLFTSFSQMKKYEKNIKILKKWWWHVHSNTDNTWATLLMLFNCKRHLCRTQQSEATLDAAWLLKSKIPSISNMKIYSIVLVCACASDLIYLYNFNRWFFLQCKFRVLY